MIARLLRWLAGTVGSGAGSEAEREVDEEFRFHLDMKTKAHIDQGMDPGEARAAGLREFGDADRLRRAGARQLRKAKKVKRRTRSPHGLVHDLGSGLTQLRRKPGYTLLAIGTLALGLTASTAVFTYVGAYARKIPGTEATRVYQLFFSSEESPWGAVSYADFLDLRGAGTDAFRVAGKGTSTPQATARHEEFTEVIRIEVVSGDLFGMLGVGTVIGRALEPEDDVPGADPVTVISHAYWLERYGGSPDVLGRTLTLNGLPHTVVGVVAPGFLGMSSSYRPHAWLPFSQYIPVYWARSDNETNRERGTVSPLVRLASGVSVSEAQARLDAFAASLNRDAPLGNRTRRYRLSPATWIHPATRDAETATTKIMLLAAAGLLLLACANVANLVLSAGARRRQEIAVRSALGATGGRLARQLLLENLVFSAVAGLVALALAEPAARRLSAYFARPSVWGTNVARMVELDPKLVPAATAVALLAGIATGLVPALRMFGRDIATELRWSRTSVVGRARAGLARYLGLQDGLVALQLALSVLLIFVASLVIRTLGVAGSVDVGFETDRTLASYVSTSSMGLAVEDRHAFFGRLIQELEGQDWIVAATVAEYAPLSPHSAMGLTADPAAGAPQVHSTVAQVWPGYLDVMGLEMLRGRTFERTDSVGAPDVVVVNAALARGLFGTTDAVGTTLHTPEQPATTARAYEVVGVVGDSHLTSVLDPLEPVAYFSLLQHYSRPGNGLVVRFAGTPSAPVDRLERALRDFDPHLAIVNVLRYRDVVDGFLYVQRMNAELFTLIAALGLVLAAAGLFSAVALSVGRRRREIGVRIAIGAARPSVVRLVLASSGIPMALGLVAGMAACWLATNPLRGLLWNTSVADPLALGAGAVTIAAAVAVAFAVPILRALRVDPVTSLRVE